MRRASSELSRTRLRVERRKIGVGEHDGRRRDVLLEVRDLAGAWNWQHDRAAPQHPGERDLTRRRLVFPGDIVERGTRPCEIAGGERVPRNEADAMRLAMVEDLLARAISEVIEVLHRRD